MEGQREVMEGQMPPLPPLATPLDPSLTVYWGPPSPRGLPDDWSTLAPSRLTPLDWGALVPSEAFTQLGCIGSQ